MGQERVNIIVTERGSRVVKRRLAGVGTTASASAQGVNLLRTALGAIGGALVLKQLLGMADAFTLIQNRLRLVTTGTENLASVTQQLLDISNETRTSFQINTELYARMARATEDLGTKQEEMLHFTRTLNQAIILSGASAAEAASGVLQLSQGLSAGALQGDEFKSISESLPIILQVITKEMGVTRGELKKLGSEGAITGEIILRAFKSARQEMQENFATTVATVGQGFTVLKNQILIFIGRLDQSLGVTQALSKGLIYVSENVEVLAKIIGAAGLTASIFLTVGAVTALTAAIAANPLGALAVAITYTISLLVMFRNEIKVSQDGIVSLGDLAAASWERISAGATKLFDLLKSAFPDITALWISLFGDLDISFEGFIKGVARLMDWQVGLWIGTANAIKVIWGGLGPALVDIVVQFINKMVTKIETGINNILKVFASLATKLPGRFGAAFEGLTDGIILDRINNIAEGSAKKLGQAINDGMAEGMKGSTAFEDSINGIFDRAEVIAKERLAKMEIQDAGGPTAPTGADAPTAQGQSRALQLLNKDIQQQVELLQMSASVREIETQFRKKGLSLLPAEQALYRAELERLQLAKQVSGVLDQVRGSEVNLAAAQAELNRQVDAGNVSLQQAAEAYRLLEAQALETQTTITAGWERGLNEISKTITDLATQTETTLVNAFNSAEDALVDFVTTGKVDFRAMVSSMLADLTRLIARMLIVKAIEAGSSGGGGSIIGALANVAGAYGGKKAGGGDVEEGNLYDVGERGRELFAPSVPGQIISNERIAKAVSPDDGGGGGGGVVIINVSSREEALAAMGSTEGRRVIINVIGDVERETE